MPLDLNFLTELKYKNDVDSVISSYVRLNRRGKNYVGLCPFHSEKTPSFTIYPENGSFFCFGCGVGGDVITFIRRIENLDYIDAVKFLADRSGMKMPEDNFDSGQSLLKTKILEINRASARLYYKNLVSNEDSPAMNYLRNRKLSTETIKHFGIGFAPMSWDFVLKNLKEKGYTQSEVISADLAVSGKNNSAYDKFRNRIIFPIIDIRGSVVAFGGRVLDDSKPKYLNTSDTFAFKKSQVLFGMNFAKNNDGQIILVEGYMDVISLHQAGFKNAVATLGTALTSEQAKLISRYANEVIIAYDSDEAGKKAANRAIDIFSNSGVYVRLIDMGECKDPDEYIKKHGSKRFKHMIETSGSDIEYKLNTIKIKHNINTPQGKVKYLTDCINVLASITNKIEREVYCSKLAEQCEISKNSIILQVEEFEKKQKKVSEKNQFKEIKMNMLGYKDKVNPSMSKYPIVVKSEESIIGIILLNPDYLEKVSADLSEEDFVSDFNKKVFIYIKNSIKNNITDLSLILSNINNEFSLEEISRITKIIADKSETWSPNEFEDCIRVLKREKEKIKLNVSSEINDADFEKLAEVIKKTKKKGNEYGGS